MGWAEWVGDPFGIAVWSRVGDGEVPSLVLARVSWLWEEISVRNEKGKKDKPACVTRFGRVANRCATDVEPREYEGGDYLPELRAKPEGISL
jgi:hypothetical protein